MVQSLAIRFEGTPKIKSQEGQKLSKKVKVVIKPSTRNIEMNKEDVKVVPEKKSKENKVPGGQFLQEENPGKKGTFKEEFLVRKLGLETKKWGESENGANEREEKKKIEKSIERKGKNNKSLRGIERAELYELEIPNQTT